MLQATQLEARGENIPEEGKMKPFKGVEKGKGKKNAPVKKEGDKLTWKHFSKGGHDEEHCWKLHPEMRPNKFNDKGK